MQSSHESKISYDVEGYVEVAHSTKLLFLSIKKDLINIQLANIGYNPFIIARTDLYIIRI